MWSGIWSVATTRIGFWTWIWSTRHWTGVRSGLLISMLGKLSWFRLTGLITMVLLMWKWMGLFLRKNHLLRCWGWPSLLNWIEALTLSLLLKLPPKKSEPWLVLWSFYLLKLLCVSIHLPYSQLWNTVVMSQLVLLVASWNCWINYKNGYVDMQDCWSFTCCLSWTLGSSLKCAQLQSFL